MSDYPNRDLELEQFCDSQRMGCESCIMRTRFKRCGQGWHVYMTTGAENEAAHKLMDVERLLHSESGGAPNG